MVSLSVWFQHLIQSLCESLRSQFLNVRSSSYHNGFLFDPVWVLWLSNCSSSREWIYYNWFLASLAVLCGSLICSVSGWISKSIMRLWELFCLKLVISGLQKGNLLLWLALAVHFHQWSSTNLCSYQHSKEWFGTDESASIENSSNRSSTVRIWKFAYWWKQSACTIP